MTRCSSPNATPPAAAPADHRQTRDAVGRLAQAQLDLNLPADKPVVILSDNSVDHALLILATMHLGPRGLHRVQRLLPADQGLRKIHAILDALDPGLVLRSTRRLRAARACLGTRGAGGVQPERGGLRAPLLRRCSTAKVAGR